MASSKKKIVTKDELRRLMKEKKSTGKNNATKINHQLAKYNSLDQLVCVLCNCVIKSDLLWTAHIQSRQHKEKLSSLKSQQSGPQMPKDSSLKRKSEFLEPPKQTKRVKENGKNSLSSGVPSDFFDKSSSQVSHSSSTKSKKVELASYSSSSEEEEEEDDSDINKSVSSKSSIQSSVQLSHPALPADFFDAGVKKEEIVEEKPKSMADILPEGFFDNPKADAKVRKVEYKDKMEEEWEMFQRAMKEETNVSEAIMEEEDEQVNVERNIDEIDDQINRWREINDLEIKKEQVTQKKKENEADNSDSSDDADEEDLNDFMDWRSKKSWK